MSFVLDLVLGPHLLHLSLLWSRQKNAEMNTTHVFTHVLLSFTLTLEA